MHSSRAQKSLILLLSATATGVLILNLCASVFRCGCQSWWAGAAQHCNIHLSGVKHCPWCSYGNAGFLIAMVFIVGPQAVISFWPKKLLWPYRLVLALAAFPIFGAIVAVVYGLISGYWA